MRVVYDCRNKGGKKGVLLGSWKHLVEGQIKMERFANRWGSRAWPCLDLFLWALDACLIARQGMLRLAWLFHLLVLGSAPGETRIETGRHVRG